MDFTGLYKDYIALRDNSSVVEHHIEQKMEHDMESVSITGFLPLPRTPKGPQKGNPHWGN